MGGRDAPPPPGRFGGPPQQDEARLMGRGEVARPLRAGGMERQASSEVSLRPTSSVFSSKRCVADCCTWTARVRTWVIDLGGSISDAICA